MSACLGIVRLGTPNASGIEYIKDAFVALKRAKSQGLGSAVEFSQDIGLQVRERSHLLRDLRMALDESQLFLTYQPQVELARAAWWGPRPCCAGGATMVPWCRPTASSRWQSSRA